MRDRRVQRLLKKTKEKGLSPKDHTGMPDVTPFEAVKRIIEEEKKQIIAAAREQIKAEYEARKRAGSEEDEIEEDIGTEEETESDPEDDGDGSKE
ncbi:MAG: hypothetical protein II779_09695 [Clostridia bacterium]|nr:hypothetical protein [Clostridia bacterium]